MKIDRTMARNAFSKYASAYDAFDEKIRLKIEHTYRVAEICEEIAVSLKMTQEDVDLAWICGLLHDIGRFEQVKRFGTFNDTASIDHAKLGADILFSKLKEQEGQSNKGNIREFVECSCEDTLIEAVIRNHSVYRISTHLSEREVQYCNILRDADKIDILKVNVEFPIEKIYNVSKAEIANAEATEMVMESFAKMQATPKAIRKTPVDMIVGHISLTFELVYPISIRIVKKQGYLDRLLQFETKNERTRKQFLELQNIMHSYMQKRQTDLMESRK